MKTFKEITEALKKGAIVATQTDTVWGLLASAKNRRAVKKIYNIKKRNPKKALIVLISSVDDLDYFGVELNHETKNKLYEYWPGAVSVILNIRRFIWFRYLHRGLGSVAFRLPADLELQKLISEVGPLVAPSANTEGGPISQNVRQARKYFGDDVLYWDRQKQNARKSSKLLSINKKGQITEIRP